MVAAVEAGDAAGADRLAAEHATQIMRQIQSYLDRQSIDDIKLAFAQHRG
jgi:DNA-binding GntR family transcriptional regulator